MHRPARKQGRYVTSVHDGARPLMHKPARKQGRYVTVLSSSFFTDGHTRCAFPLVLASWLHSASHIALAYARACAKSTLHIAQGYARACATPWIPSSHIALAY